MKTVLRKIVAIGFILTVISGLAGQNELRAEATVSIDFTNVDIREFVKTVTKITGRNFIIDAKVKGNINIISPSPVTVRQAYQVFLTVLDSMGYTVVQSGEVYQIIQNANAKSSNLPIYFGRGFSGTDLTITRILPLEYVQADEIMPVIQDFLSKSGLIKAYVPTNSLIIVDTGRNIDKVMRLIEEFDTPRGSAEVEIIPIRYAVASTIADLLMKIYESGASAKPKKAKAKRGRGKAVATTTGSDTPEVEGADDISKIIPDDRTNSLIVIATSNELSALRELIAKLDTPENETGGSIHVIYLEHADAEQMSSTLSALSSGASSQKNIPARPNKAQAKAGSGQSIAQFEGGVKITAHKSTNSLVIIASKNDMMTLRKVIEKLDIPRRQVFVEAIIMEVSLEKSIEFGLAGHMGAPIQNNEGLAFGSSGGSTVLMGANPAAAIGGGLTAGILGKPVKIESEGVSISLPAFGALLKASQTDSDVNILSTPNLLTSDNEEASIVVGQNVPFITGQSTTTGGNVMTQIERKDVGITLTLTPQINESDKIRLSINQEISSVNPSSGGIVDVNQQGLITRKRSAKTTVVVGDRQTVVIAGLMEDKLSEGESKIPVLGDIPLLGWLFKSTSNQVSKTNLVIMITPYIVKNEEDILLYSLKKEEELINFKRMHGLTDHSERFVLDSYINRNHLMDAPGPAFESKDFMKVRPVSETPENSSVKDDYAADAAPEESAEPKSEPKYSSPGVSMDGDTPSSEIPAPPENLEVTPEEE